MPRFRTAVLRLAVVIALALSAGTSPHGNEGAGLPIVQESEALEPPFTFEHVLLTGPSYSDYAGSAVALDGGVLAIGSPRKDVVASDAGEVSLCQQDPAGDWQPVQSLSGDGIGFEHFGQSLALDGSTLVVGAPDDYDDDGSGSAYVFVEDGGVWRRQGRLIPATAQVDDACGWRVALAGDLAVVGCPRARVDGVQRGAAYLFRRNGTDWIEESRLWPADPSDPLRFGTSVATDGTFVAVGAPDTSRGAGAVYVFEQGADGWEQTAALDRPGSVSYDDFGLAVDLHADVLVVGAPGVRTAHVFRNVGGIWTWEQALSSSDPDGSNDFGDMVVAADDTILVGSPGADVGSRYSVGAGLVYRFSGVWLADAQLTLGEDAYCYLGTSGAISGRTIVLGAPFAGHTGGVAVYTGRPDPRSVLPRIVPTRGGTTVSVSGRGFMQGASAAVDGVSLAGVTVADAQTLIATVPAHAPGKTAVTVTNPGGDSGNRAAVLRYADVDLLLQGMTAPKAGAPDRRFVATTTTRNIGAHASDTTVTRFYLSRDAVLDAADVLLGQHKVPALAPGKTHVGNASLLTPYATAAGEYYLLAQADSAGLVAELSETNNGRAARFSVGSNLAVTALTALPTARADEGLDITVTTANTGPASTGRTSTTTVYLSADQSTGGSDVTLGSVYISDLDPREAQRKLASVLIPANTRPGIYYLVAKADAGSYVTEINEDDNTRARPVEILPAITRPDRKR